MKFNVFTPAHINKKACNKGRLGFIAIIVTANPLNLIFVSYENWCLIT